MEIFKRTFEAEKFPKGSPERDRLNECTETSEYMKSYKFIVAEEDYKEVPNRMRRSFRTKKEAEIFLSLAASTTNHSHI